FQFGERRRAVDLRRSGAELVEVGAVDHKYERTSRHHATTSYARSIASRGTSETTRARPGASSTTNRIPASYFLSPRITSITAASGTSPAPRVGKPSASSTRRCSATKFG